MTPLSASERAAITAAERAGKVQRLPAPCPYWGGRFDRLPNDGDEIEGALPPLKNTKWTVSRRRLRDVLMEEGINWVGMTQDFVRGRVR